MSDIIHKLFGLAMDTLPYTPNPAQDAAKEALEAYLGKEGKPLLTAYEDTWHDSCWETAEQAFYIGLSLGIELATFTPSAAVCRRT